MSIPTPRRRSRPHNCGLDQGNPTRTGTRSTGVPLAQQFYTGWTDAYGVAARVRAARRVASERGGEGRSITAPGGRWSPPAAAGHRPPRRARSPRGRATPRCWGWGGPSAPWWPPDVQRPPPGAERWPIGGGLLTGPLRRRPQQPRAPGTASRRLLALGRLRGRVQRQDDGQPAQDRPRSALVAVGDRPREVSHGLPHLHLVFRQTLAVDGELVVHEVKYGLHLGQPDRGNMVSRRRPDVGCRPLISCSVGAGHVSRPPAGRPRPEERRMPRGCGAGPGTRR